MSTDASFLRATVLKVAFCPEPLRRCQAALIYRALESSSDFTADEVLCGELVGDDTKIAGITVGSLAAMKLIQRTGRCKSPSPSRNGCWVNRWALGEGKRGTALTFLARNGFPPPSAKQLDFISLALT